MKIKYNAPVTLTFAFFCIGILLLKYLIFPNLVELFFTVPSHTDFLPTNPTNYILLFTHVLGHADWTHLFLNLSFILLLGPLLEEVYGSPILLLMIVTTAFVTGVLNICFSTKGLLGSSGIAFMMILLSSFTNIKNGEIPLTFLIVLFLYLREDVVMAFKTDDISHFTHLVGGFCGSLFGFFRSASLDSSKTSRTTKSKPNTSKSTEEKS